MQLHALNKAIYKMHKNPLSATGLDKKGNPVIEMEMAGAGHGYKPNNKNKSNPYHLENLNKVEVRFDKNNPKRPFTAFPK